MRGMLSCVLVCLSTGGCGSTTGGEADMDAGVDVVTSPESGVGVDADTGATPPSIDAAVDSSAVPSIDAGDASSLDVCRVMSAFETAALMAPRRDSGGYVPPPAMEVSELMRSIRAAISGDEATAVVAAGGAGYRLCRGEGAEEGLLLWAPVAADEGRARVALRSDALVASGLIFEAPHPFVDTDTGGEAARLFTMLGARALVVSGTHRCAASTASPCDGVTGVCTGAGDAPYPVSDPAHEVTGTFHAAHRALAEAYAGDVVVSVHGMSGTGISVSDGTTAPTDSTSFVARLASALAARFAGVTSCNSGAGVPRDVRLCGSTNVQGRHVNGAADACFASARSATGRFVHMEQSRAVRDRTTDVVQAFADVAR